MAPGLLLPRMLLFPRRTSTSCYWWLRRRGGKRCRFLCMIVTVMSETACKEVRGKTSTIMYTRNARHGWPLFLKTKKMELLEKYPRFAHKVFWNVFFFLARIGRPDILWSMTSLFRAVTKWTGAHDRRLARLISYNSSHKSTPTILSWGKHITTMQNRIISRFWFCKRPWRLKSNISSLLCIIGSQTYIPISWMWKKQTSVSHSSTEAEVISVDAGLRMDEIPALHRNPAIWRWYPWF